MTPVVVPVIGISQRSGTHWTADLLAVHPGCRHAMARTGQAGSGWEDLVFEQAHHLSSFAADVRRRWGQGFDDAAMEARLLTALGTGLASFVADPDGSAGTVGTPGRSLTESHVVTRSPTADGLHLLPRLWPDARPVLVVRDGGDVVASALRSFGGSAERWIRVWRAGARQILAFGNEHPGVGLVVRYEDLIDDLGPQMTRILRHVGLDPGPYDFDRAADLGVRGSSDGAHGQGGVQWGPTHPDDFHPVGRKVSLPSATRHRLAWLAGPELASLGYDTADAPASLEHRMRDAAWAVARLGRRALGR